MRKNLKVLLTLIVVVALLFSSVISVYADSKGHENNGKGKLNQGQFMKYFKDLDKNFWAYEAIMELVNLGVINGIPDNTGYTFEPNASVTRSQFASMLTKALDLKASDNTQTFEDVPPTSWDFTVVEAAKDYLTGYKTSDGTLYFYGSRNAVREDMAVALVKALDLTLDSDNGQLEQVFKDYDAISASLRDYVYTAYENGLMIGSGGKFAPQGNLTRAEAATLLYRALQKTEKIPVDGSDGDKVVVDPGDGTALHTDATLSSLKFNGSSIAGFSAATSIYNVVLPAGTTAVPTVTATVHDTGNATVHIDQASDLPGHATVIVTAEDGTTHKTYTVNFSVAAAPESTDATLKDLSINGADLAGFDPDVHSYNVVLPAGTTAIPVVTAVVHDTGNATLKVTQASDLPGHATVAVTAEDGTTKLTYTVNFTVAVTPKSTDATLKDLSLDGTELTGFDPDVLTYSVVFPAGTTAIPVVTAVVHDTGAATLKVTQASDLPGHATVVVTAEDGTTKLTYTINFTVSAQ